MCVRQLTGQFRSCVPDIYLGVPDASGYTYLGGGVYPRSVVTYSEDVEITIPLKPISWDVSYSYTADSGGFTRVSVMLDLGSPDVRLYNDLPQLYLEVAGTTLDFRESWRIDGTVYSAGEEFSGDYYDRLYTRPDPVGFFDIWTPLPGGGRWRIGYSGSDPVMYDLFNVPIPHEVYDPKDLSVTLFWDL